MHETKISRERKIKISWKSYLVNLFYSFTSFCLNADLNFAAIAVNSPVFMAMAMGKYHRRQDFV